MEYGKELGSIHKIQLGILKRIIEICEEYEIDYFIDSGTALGAVRHKGFIPWDDDIDLGMTRPHYNRFLSVAQEKLGDDYFLQTFHTDPNSPFYFAKVRKTGTKFVEGYCRDLDMHHGIFVDVFPYDHMANNSVLKIWQALGISFFKKIYVSKCVRELSVPQKNFFGKIKLTARGMLHFLLKPVSKEVLFNALDRTIQRYNGQEGTPVTNWADKKGYWRSMDHDMIHPMKKIEFEHLTVSAINRVDVWLERAYGDYMTYPPECERFGHRPFMLDAGFDSKCKQFNVPREKKDIDNRFTCDNSHCRNKRRIHDANGFE